MRESSDRRLVHGLLQMAPAAFFLVFLWSTFARLVDRLPQTWAWIGLTSMIAFVVVYLWRLSATPSWHGRRNLVGSVWVAFGVAMTALAAPAAGDLSMVALVYVAALATGVMTTRPALAVVLALVAGTTIAGNTIHGWSTDGIGLSILLASAAVWSFRRQAVSSEQALSAERELTELAVDRERTKIAQDLHDILGHSLTVIAMKSELAEKLLDADPARARTELEQVQRLARDALADVRATTHGLQGRSLPTEIAAARQALDSAGIEARLPTVTDDIPTRERELFAWTVREAVTNVLRHSGARTCTIDAEPGRLTVTDDGRGAVDPDAQGSGLAGLRRRAAEAGAVVTTAAGPDGRGFRLTVEVR